MGKAFVIFEIILSIALTNMLLIGGSLLSVFLLFPVLLISTLYYLRRMYLYREFTGIIYNYAHFIRGNILSSIKILFPLVLFIGFLLLSIFYYNRVMIELFHPFLVILIFVVQAFMLYQAVGVMLVSAILYAQFKEKHHDETPTYALLNKGFIILNAHPVRGFLSIISLIMGTVFIIRLVPFFYLIVLPIGLFAFYVVFSDVIEQKKYV